MTPILKLSKDQYGCKILAVTFIGANGFKVQTNQNLPKVHSMRKDNFDYKIALESLDNYVKLYGTRRQRILLGF